MSIKLINAIWDQGPKQTSHRFVLLALADQANDAGHCWPSYATIADRTCMERPSVIRIVKKLEAEGWLSLKKRTKADGRPNSNLILINVARLGMVIEDDYMVTEDDYQEARDGNRGLPDSNPGLPTMVIVDDCNSNPGLPDPSLIHQKNRQQNHQRRGAPARPPDDNPLIAQAPPAVALIARLTDTWPGVNNEAFLVERLGERPNEALLARAVTLWRGAGNRINNYGGICDWYDELCADTTWTPAARFKNGKAKNGTTLPAPATSTSSYLF